MCKSFFRSLFGGDVGTGGRQITVDQRESDPVVKEMNTDSLNLSAPRKKKADDDTSLPGLGL